MDEDNGKIPKIAEDKICYLKIEIQSDVFVEEEKHEDCGQQMFEESAFGGSSKRQHEKEDPAEYDNSVLQFLDKKFTCELCSTGFDCRSSLRVHMSVYHGQTSLTCTAGKRSDLGGLRKPLGSTPHPSNGHDQAADPGHTVQTLAQQYTSKQNSRADLPQTCGPRHSRLVHNMPDMREGYGQTLSTQHTIEETWRACHESLPSLEEAVPQHASAEDPGAYQVHTLQKRGPQNWRAYSGNSAKAHGPHYSSGNIKRQGKSSSRRQHENEDPAEYDPCVLLYLDKKFTCQLCSTGFHHPSSLRVHMCVYHGHTSLTLAKDQRVDCGGTPKLSGATPHSSHSPDQTEQTVQMLAQRYTGQQNSMANHENMPLTFGPQLTSLVPDMPHMRKNCGQMLSPQQTFEENGRVYRRSSPLALGPRHTRTEDSAVNQVHTLQMIGPQHTNEENQRAYPANAPKAQGPQHTSGKIKRMGNTRDYLEHFESQIANVSAQINEKFSKPVVETCKLLNTDRSARELCSPSFLQSRSPKNHMSSYNVQHGQQLGSRDVIRVIHADQKRASCAGHTAMQKLVPIGKKRRRYKCEHCGKSYSYSSSLKRHLNIHTGDKPYKCADCGKAFRLSSSLWSHRSVHTGLKPYKCADCSETFNSAQHLKLHRCVHVGDQPYKCEGCSRTFRTLEGLKKHLGLDRVDKPYKCMDCGKAFTLLENMKRHHGIDTGHKPYKCAGCGKAFCYDGLKSHFKVHKRKTPYKCADFSKTFTRLEGLTKQLLVQTGDKTLQVCGLWQLLQYDNVVSV